MLSACGDGDPIGGEENIDPGENPTDIITVVNVSINNTFVDVSNPAEVVAKVTTDGKPVSGIVVSFESDLGAFASESPTALTNDNGFATITLTAGAVQGAGTVTASIDSGESGTVGFETAGDGVDPNDIDGTGNDAQFIVEVTLSDSHVTAAAPVTVTATLSDLVNNDVAGKVMTFTTDVGSLSPKSGKTLTNDQGQATIQLNAGDVKSAGTIRATTPNGIYGEVSFSSEGDGQELAGKQVTVSISNQNVSASSPASIMVNVTDEDGNVAGEVVNFSTTLGVLDPASGSRLTDAFGNATITLNAGTIEGAGIVTAALSSGEFDSVGFSTLGDALPVVGNKVTLTLSNTLLDSTNNSTLIATVVDSDNNPVVGEIVNFAATLGHLNPESGTALTDGSGVATIVLTAGQNAGAGVASATIDSGSTARVNFQTAGDETAGGEIITLSISNTALDNLNSAILTANIVNDDGPVVGEVVSFSSTLGFLDPKSGTALTDSNGDATIILTAGSVEGAGLVTATSMSGEKATIGFVTAGDQADGISVQVNLVDPNTGNDITVINATTPGRLIATVFGIDSPTIVTFTTDIGEIPVPTAITDGANQAFVDIYSGNDLGAGTVTATLKDGESGEKLLVVGANNLSMVNVTGPVGSISAGGTAVISVDIVDENGAPYTLPVEVNFSSSCVLSGDATLNSPVTTNNGTASSTYLAKGCINDDLINITANAGGLNLAEDLIVNVLRADVGSIEFINVAPETIALKGVGGLETAAVQFRVLDKFGDPVEGADVDFELNTTTGGVNLEQMSATTGEGGIVTAIVNSGTIATPVRVTASINGSLPLISSQSSLLVISTGIPDQDSFTLTASEYNPEGWDVFGTQVIVTARLSDAFNNPVPDGTAVSFTTEGGSIEPSCVTANGECNVIWTSQNPRPQGPEFTDPDNLPPNSEPKVINPIDLELGRMVGGRATVLATAIGEESFADSNGNGLFDLGDEVTNFNNGVDVSGRPYDLPEAFVDHNEDGIFDTSVEGAANEEFFDFDNEGDYDIADSKYNGSLCSDGRRPEFADNSANCSDVKSINIREQIVIVMSGSNAQLAPNGTGNAIDLDPDFTPDPLLDETTVYIVGENTGWASVIISDLHNQPMPKGTIIEFTATAGSIVGPDTFEWPNDNHNGGRSFSVSIEGEDEPKTGSLLIQVTTPAGFTNVFSPIDIVIGAVPEEEEVVPAP